MNGVSSTSPTPSSNRSTLIVHSYSEASQVQQSNNVPSLIAPVTMPIANGTPSSFPSGHYSAATEELLRRVSASGAAQTGTPGYEAAREKILKSMVTSDKLPLPPPLPTGKRGRGAGRASLTHTDGHGLATSTPEQPRGRGRGRPRGRGRGSRQRGRGGKRKRTESEAEESDGMLTDDLKYGSDEPDRDDNEEDVSDSYTPLPTRTKSGRNITKPSQFVPTIPSPASGTKKKRPYRRNPESALCKACHRGHSPSNNQVVFCDGCGGAYHQYCHNPPIDKEVILIPEKEWFCAACSKERNEVITGTTLEGLVSGEKMSMEQKRNYLSTLSPPRLIDLLLHATALHPSLPLFPKNMNPAAISASSSSLEASSMPTQPSTTTTSTLQSCPDRPPLAPSEDIHPPAEEQYDGYDTDPPAHYPKPGNGLARTLRPDFEDLEHLVDDNFEVFSHQISYVGDHDVL